MNKVVSKKVSIAVLILLAVVVIGSLIGTVFGHQAYIENQKATIENLDPSVNALLQIRLDGRIVYKYETGKTSVDLNEIAEVSDGASLHVLKVLDKDGNVVGEKSKTIDVAGDKQCFVLLEVWSKAQKKKNSYVLEIVEKSRYDEDFTFSFVPIAEDQITIK